MGPFSSSQNHVGVVPSPDGDGVLVQVNGVTAYQLKNSSGKLHGFPHSAPLTGIVERDPTTGGCKVEQTI